MFNQVGRYKVAGECTWHTPLTIFISYFSKQKQTPLLLIIDAIKAIKSLAQVRLNRDEVEETVAYNKQ